MIRRFQEKIVIVTGAASGIGRTTAEMFAAEGARVVVADINHAGAEAVAHDINHRVAANIESNNTNDDFGAVTVAVKCDISHEAEVRNLIDCTVERFGKIDVLVNNAAMFLRRGVHTATFDDWARIMQTNVAGTAMCSRYAAEAMRVTGGGAMVVVSSMNGKRADKNYATYCASKAALLMLVRCMALDFADVPMRVNAVVPGAVETPALYAALDEAGLTLDEFLPLAEAQQCLKGYVQPADVAAAILFLASDAARMITGAEILVDAGWQAGK